MSREQLREYYQHGAAEYDATGWDLLEREHGDEVEALSRVIATMAPATTLDVGCGTAYLTRWLQRPVVGLDASETMLRLASERAPAARLVRADGLALPFSDSTFDRVIAAHTSTDTCSMRTGCGSWRKLDVSPRSW